MNGDRQKDRLREQSEQATIENSDRTIDRSPLCVRAPRTYRWVTETEAGSGKWEST